MAQEETEEKRRIRSPLLTGLLWTMASVPSIWLILFGLFLARAHAALGRWPRPYDPDPRDLGFDVHLMALTAGMPVVFASVISVFLLTAVLFRPAARWHPIQIAALASLAATIAIAQADPGRLFTWLGD